MALPTIANLTAEAQPEAVLCLTHSQVAAMVEASPEITRMRAIEAAARDLEKIWNAAEGTRLSDWTMATFAARERLFALLDSPPTA